MIVRFLAPSSSPALVNEVLTDMEPFVNTGHLKKKAWVWTCFNAKTLDGVDNLIAAVIKISSIVFSSLLAVDQRNSIVLSSLLTVYQKKVDH